MERDVIKDITRGLDLMRQGYNILANSGAYIITNNGSKPISGAKVTFMPEETQVGVRAHNGARSYHRVAEGGRDEAKALLIGAIDFDRSDRDFTIFYEVGLYGIVEYRVLGPHIVEGSFICYEAGKPKEVKVFTREEIDELFLVRPAAELYYQELIATAYEQSKTLSE